MNLLIISDMPHYIREAEAVGWGPTVQEIEELCTVFDNIRLIACLYTDPAPASALKYSSSNIELNLLKPTGGPRLKDKIRILQYLPTYLREITKELDRADIVQVRCPANVSLLAILLLSIRKSPKFRWAKYGCNWAPGIREAITYTFQRWWLNNGYHRGLVTINGSWPNQPNHVLSFYNPCLYNSELIRERSNSYDKNLTSPINILFVGRVENQKGFLSVLTICKKIKSRNINFILNVVGDGPNREYYEKIARYYGIIENIVFHGWLPKPSLAFIYRSSHFLLLPSKSEGWPKVISEAMAYGTIPIAGAVSSIPQVLKEIKVGQAVAVSNDEAFVESIVFYIANPSIWKEESTRAKTVSGFFTYEYYLKALKKAFEENWGLRL